MKFFVPTVQHSLLVVKMLPAIPTEIEDIGCDDCDIPISKVVAAIVDQNIPEGTDLCPNGGLMSTAAAESVEEEGHEGEGKAAADMRAVAEGENKGRGKRKRVPNKLYAAHTFWHHNDDEPSDIEC